MVLGHRAGQGSVGWCQAGGLLGIRGHVSAPLFPELRQCVPSPDFSVFPSDSVLVPPLLEKPLLFWCSRPWLNSPSAHACSICAPARVHPVCTLCAHPRFGWGRTLRSLAGCAIHPVSATCSMWMTVTSRRGSVGEDGAGSEDVEVVHVPGIKFRRCRRHLGKTSPSHLSPQVPAVPRFLCLPERSGVLAAFLLSTRSGAHGRSEHLRCVSAAGPWGCCGFRPRAPP